MMRYNNVGTEKDEKEKDEQGHPTERAESAERYIGSTESSIDRAFGKLHRNVWTVDCADVRLGLITGCMSELLCSYDIAL